MTALMLGQMVAGAAGTQAQGAQQAQQAIAQHIEFQNQEFVRQMEVDAKNQQINQANAIKLINNRKTAQALGKQFGGQSFIADANFKTAMRNQSIGYAKIKAAADSLTSGKNLNPNSGSIAAINRMSQDNFFELAYRQNFQNKVAMQNLADQRSGQLASIDGYMDSNALYFPGINSAPNPDAILDAANASANLQLVTAAIGAGLSIKK